MDVKRWLKTDGKKFLSYVLVGGLATVVEWLFFRLFDGVMHIQYLVATVLAIIISTFSNWLFGRLLTFRGAQKGNLLLEIGKVYAASVIGLLLNLLLMWIMVDLLGLVVWEKMLAKIIATGLVFLYNYLIRVLVIYRQKKDA